MFFARGTVRSPRSADLLRPRAGLTETGTKLFDRYDGAGPFSALQVNTPILKLPKFWVAKYISNYFATAPNGVVQTGLRTVYLPVRNASTHRYRYRVLDVGPLSDLAELEILQTLIDDDERIRQVSEADMYKTEKKQ